ncbi:hypothetical protein KSP39_PZI017630 [Platanthera zijinensis]|uniref:ARM repeat superfamily protein n=1 Tax=Platanthera zijinensis TaxID=2320716 RepID=A0AAP0B4K6_9ASPA
MDSAPTLDLASFLQAASEFASYPGAVNDAAAKEFLNRFPLPVLFGVLQMEVDVPKLEDTTVACLNRILRTGYGSSLLLQYIVFLQAGLRASSESIRCLACKSVYYILENNEDKEAAAKIIIEHDICPLLIHCLLDGNEGTFSASMSAIQSIAKSAEGINAIFPSGSEDPLELKNIAGHCSSLARIRILALIKELFSLSENVASLIYSSNLLKLFEVEINGRSDMLTILSALEILYELAESPHSAKFLLKTSLLQLLTVMISNDTVDSILRSRAMLISGRLLSTPAALKAIDPSRINALLLTIDGRLNLVESQSLDEVENAVEAVGRVGSSADGAALLLTSLSLMVKHVVELAFDRQGRGKQLAALHTLGSIAGADRSNESVLLNKSAEECLKRMIYEAAVSSPKLTPSGLFLSILQQEPEMRLAAYRLITVLSARKWCLMELCSKLEITSIVMDANIEDTKMGMEARHRCCAAIYHSLSASNMITDAKVANLAEQLQEAVKRGPYQVKKRIEAQPIVITADRF